MKKVKFTTAEKRIMQLPFDKSSETDPASKPLRKIIDKYPWMLTVMDCDFDDLVSHHGMLLQHAYHNFENAIKDYKKRRKALTKKDE